MEKLLLIALLCALPAITFITIAKITGGKNRLGYVFFLKLPTLVSLFLLIIYVLKYFKII